jgi:hypothetical protein
MLLVIIQLPLNRVIAISNFGLWTLDFRRFLGKSPKCPNSSFGKVGEKHGKYQTTIFSSVFKISGFISSLTYPNGWYFHEHLLFFVFGFRDDTITAARENILMFAHLLLYFRIGHFILCLILNKRYQRGAERRQSATARMDLL